MIASPVQGEVDCRRQDGGVVRPYGACLYNPSASLRSAPSLTQGGQKTRQLPSVICSFLLSNDFPKTLE